MLLKNINTEFRKNPLITSINVIGYAVALSACIIIGSYVFYQASYNKFNTNIERIYRLNYKNSDKGTTNASLNHQWFDVLPSEFPEIEKMARFGWSWENKIIYQEHEFTASGAEGDKELFDIFSFPVLEKSSDNFFENPRSVAISASLAKKIFGDSDAIGKNFRLNYDHDYTVSAVFKDIPENSSVKFDFLTSANDLLDDYGDYMKKHWTWWMWRTFVLLDEDAHAAAFGDRMKPLQKKHIGEWHANTFHYYLQPLKDIHLKSADVAGSFSSDVSITFIYIFISAGLLILLISCFNYINLSVAGFERRKRSVSIHKIIGASRSLLFKQYTFYSIVLNIISITFAVLITALVLPLLSDWGIKEVRVPFDNIWFWFIIFGFSIIVGILSGIYPALFISKTVAKINSESVKTNMTFRNVLLTLQFAIAIVLLISASTIRKQLNECIYCELGYNHSSLISIGGTNNIWDHYESFHDELRKIPGVLETTSCSFNLPGYFGNFWPVKPEGTIESIEIFHTYVTSNFFDVLAIPVITKIGEIKEDTSRTMNNALINEEAFKQFNQGNAILGKTYKLGEMTVTVTGVVSNFHNNSLRDKIKPLQFNIIDKGWNNIVRLDDMSSKNTIAEIKKVWEKFEPVIPFNHSVIDDLISNQYSKEQSYLKIINMFFWLAILISLLGLIGLVQLTIQFRIKEIGIRKVNGARIRDVVFLLNKGVIIWVLTAFIIACPISWYAMNKWLENFAYKIDLSWWVFLMSGIFTLLVTSLTLTIVSWKTARRNPVEALRYE